MFLCFSFWVLFGCRITAGKGKKQEARRGENCCEVFWLTKSVNAGFGMGKLCNFLGALWFLRSLFIIYQRYVFLFL